MKIYNDFSDKFGNQYGFKTYDDFATFWFNLSRKAAKLHFPHNFDALQKCAETSKEAKTKYQSA